MQQNEIHQYLEHFLETNDCKIVNRSSGLLEIQLTIEMDKLLMNRPFYWHYLEKTGGIPNPMKVTFITDQDEVDESVKGEQIHFGSPRLHQIFSIVKDLGQSISLYENVQPPNGQQLPLHPWLAVNYQVSFTCDRKRDILYSFGIHLISGQIIENFHPILSNLSFSGKIPDFCYCISPIIKPVSGLNRLEQLLTKIIEKEDEMWAEEARNRWEHDLQLLNQFYEGTEDSPESYKVEKNALKELYDPVIHVNVINGGLFYLSLPTMHSFLSSNEKQNN
ncbi:YqhG family protein [Bacillus sp. RG28]|uniref:YqhG family protein n=1 Tax=Gottfriedia endophytica TaxID=2820819 RepID=A0A940SJQ9_9BACI|nr:YqhG family protein [Gottfriedia endophytica]MBP0724488.1 YqhG family protein [Gottfriedia endophytica]